MQINKNISIDQQKFNKISKKDFSYENMKSVMEARNWSDTSLGSMKDWPQSLKVALDICLGSEFTLLAPLKDSKHSEIEENEESDISMKAKRANQQVNVLLVDDHKMMREGLRKIVNDQEDLEVIAEASDGMEAVEVARKKNPDVVVMDIDMPGMNGIDATRELLSDGQDLSVIGLSLHGHESVIDSMRKAGASAYITKNQAFETLCTTIRSEAATTT